MARIIASAASFPVFLILLVSSACLAQSGPCDVSLKPASNNPNRYRVLDQDPFRCEGMYTNQVAATGSILLVTLVHGANQMDPRPGSVSASWKGPANSETRLRAYSLLDTIYYRMDSRLPAGRSSYTWPTAIPANVGLHSGEVGLVAWTPAEVFTEKRDVYLPIALTPASPEKRLTASFWAPTGLSKVTLEVSLLRDKTSAQRIMELVKPGQYPPRRRIDFLIESLPSSGFYELTITGEDTAHHPWSDTYIMYNP